MRYFSDYQGQTVELDHYFPISNKEFAALFGELKGRRYDSFSKCVSKHKGILLPLTRSITYKNNPSLHECNSKCMSGKPNGTCECSCGGKNHGINS